MMPGLAESVNSAARRLFSAQNLLDLLQSTNGFFLSPVAGSTATADQFSEKRAKEGIEYSPWIADNGAMSNRQAVTTCTEHGA